MLRKIALAIVLVLGCAGVTLGEAAVEAKPDPYENTSVLVEAFVVKVSTEALTEVGINPIGQSPEGISILKILACLNDPEKAKVVSGAKVTARNGQESRFNNRNIVVVKSQRGDSVSYQDYENGIELEARPYVKTEKTLELESVISILLLEESEDEAGPPDRFSFDWSGVITTQSGKPAIAGAAQNDDSVTFLILTATIRD